MASLGDEWSDRVDIVQRALAVLDKETRSWGLPAAAGEAEPQTRSEASPTTGEEQ
jgi:hypothetical protein